MLPIAGVLSRKNILEFLKLKPGVITFIKLQKLDMKAIFNLMITERTQTRAA